MRKLLITLVVLVGVAVAADFGLRWYATEQISKAVAARLQLTADPGVSITGFPFVLQAIDGHYETITAALPPATYGPVGGVVVDVDLIGVRVPLSDAIAGDLSHSTADRSRVRVQIPVASIAVAVARPDLQITAAPGGALQVGATVDVLGSSYPVSAVLGASVTDSVLQLRTGAVTGAGITLPAEALGPLADLLVLDIPLSGLPFAITDAQVTVSGATLVVTAATTTIDFATLS